MAADYDASLIIWFHLVFFQYSVLFFKVSSAPIYDVVNQLPHSLNS